MQIRRAGSEPRVGTPRWNPAPFGLECFFVGCRQMRIGIIGHGIVGLATALFGQATDVEVLSHDPDPELCTPLGTSLRDVSECEIIFVCVPTPMSMNGACDLDAVTDLLQLLRDEECQGHIVIRSTVIPGTTRKLGCHCMPEFLTDAGWETDVKTTPRWLIGVNDHLPQAGAFRRIMQTLVTSVRTAGLIDHNEIVFVTPEEAEVTKYARNAHLAAKVGVSNEIATYCERIGVSYDVVRDNVGVDPRIGSSHMLVPGPDGKRGFGGSSLMKDLMAFCMVMDGVGTSSFVLRPILGRNARRDRPDEVWYQQPKVLELTAEQLSSVALGQIRSMCTRRNIPMEQGIERGVLETRILKQIQDEQRQRQQQQTERTNARRQQQQPVPVAPPIYAAAPVGNPFVQRSGSLMNTQSRPVGRSPVGAPSGPSFGFTGGVQS
jgi:hypothetical protein